MTSIIQRMNTSNAKDYLPFVQAMADKKVVEVVNVCGRWDAVSDTTFNLPPNCYRIKPKPRKPRERWVNVYPVTYLMDETIYPTKESADEHKSSSRTECVHYKEVIDES